MYKEYGNKIRLLAFDKILARVKTRLEKKTCVKQ